MPRSRIRKTGWSYRNEGWSAIATGFKSRGAPNRFDKVTPMRWIAITLILVTSLCYARHCPDPKLRQAVIGGETVGGSVRLHNKPLKHAQVRLFFPNGEPAWVGKTDKDGRFHVRSLRPDTYRLDVRGWGSTSIRITPDLTKLSNGQTVFYSVQLIENECTATTAVTN